MSLIVRRGKVPKTPHSEFYAIDGVLSLEEIHGCYGFSGAYSRKMHVRRYPTAIVKPPRAETFHLKPEPAFDLPLQPLHILTGRIAAQKDFTRSRHALLVGTTTALSVSKPTRSTPQGEYFRNGDGHELFFVQEGSGVLASEYGELPFSPGLYIVVPKGTTYRVILKSPKAFFFIVESLYPVHFAPHYLNPHGQATLMAPVVESEIGLPELGDPQDKKGEYKIITKHDGGRLTRLTLGHDPFDLAGWEGALYPFTFDSADHHSLAREIHTSPATRQTFQSGDAPKSGFSVCTFLGQVEGWNPLDVPAPFAHFNVDSDEAMFFSDASYGARKGVIEPGSLTFHPGSLPHSPQGDAARRSLATRGQKSSYLAIMIDTFFETLRPTKHALAYCDKGYPLSWAKADKRAGGGAVSSA